MKKKWIWAVITLTLMTSTVFFSCNSDNDESEPMVTPSEEQEDPTDSISTDTLKEFVPIQLTRAEQKLVNNNNDFAFNLMRKALDETQSQILSPISITYALGLLSNGADGETETQILNVLGFGFCNDENAIDNSDINININDFCRKMLSEAPDLDPLTKVMIANTIYMNKDYVLQPGFIAAANEYYDAEPETRDFHDGKTMDVINQWASDHTMKMIDKVLSEDSFNPDAVSYLLNAIYFKGKWTFPFEKDYTRDETFHAPSGPVLKPMMCQFHEFVYSENDVCQSVTLPYGNGAYSMTILLPHKDKSVGDVLTTLDGNSFLHYVYSSIEKVDVKLPRFESRTDVSLKKIMSALGMPNAFDPELAEFPRFCNIPVYISMMKQVARIKLDEQGTEAAAVTVIGDGATALPTEKPTYYEFHADRPFLYVISEQSTGAIFFIGQYAGD